MEKSRFFNFESESRYFFNVLFICFTRVVVRVYFSHFKNQPIFGKVQSKKRLVLIGAGKTGSKIAQEILNTVEAPYVVVGFIDDDIDKLGGRLHGIRVLGTTADLEKLIIPFDELLITAPAATGDELRKRLQGIADHHDAQYQIMGRGSMICIHPQRDPISNPTLSKASSPSARNLFHLEMHMRGCYISRRGFMSLCLPLTKADHDQFADAFESVALEFGEVLEQQ